MRDALILSDQSTVLRRVIASLLTRGLPGTAIKTDRPRSPRRDNAELTDRSSSSQSLGSPESVINRRAAGSAVIFPGHRRGQR